MWAGNPVEGRITIISRFGHSFWLNLLTFGCLLFFLSSLALASVSTLHEEMKDFPSIVTNWGLAFATLFSGCAIYIGFIASANEQKLNRRFEQVREATSLLRRFRTDPWLLLFVQMVDWEMFGARKLAFPPGAEALFPEKHYFNYDPAKMKLWLSGAVSTSPDTLYDTEFSEETFLYSDAFNIGLDYLTEIAQLVKNGIIPYEDLSTLAYFFERMRDPKFADGMLTKYLEKFKYFSVLDLLKNDPAVIAR